MSDPSSTLPRFGRTIAPPGKRGLRVVRECSPLELRARLALLAAPDGVLTEGALSKALGRTSRPLRDALLGKLAAEGIVSLEPARRGRRVRLVAPERAITGDLRAPARGRFSGAVVNALLSRLTVTREDAAVPLSERVVAAHDALARDKGGTVELTALRASLPDVDGAELDRVLIELDRGGVLALGRPVDLAALDERARAASRRRSSRRWSMASRRTCDAL